MKLYRQQPRRRTQRQAWRQYRFLVVSPRKQHSHGHHQKCWLTRIIRDPSDVPNVHILLFSFLHTFRWNNLSDMIGSVHFEMAEKWNSFLWFTRSLLFLNSLSFAHFYSSKKFHHANLFAKISDFLKLELFTNQPNSQTFDRFVTIRGIERDIRNVEVTHDERIVLNVSYGKNISTWSVYA